MKKFKWNQNCTPPLQQLNWLPIFEWKYKTVCMCYNAITSSAPSYLSELLHLYVQPFYQCTTHVLTHSSTYYWWWHQLQNTPVSKKWKFHTHGTACWVQTGFKYFGFADSDTERVVTILCKIFWFLVCVCVTVCVEIVKHFEPILLWNRVSAKRVSLLLLILLLYF